jgi:hypothetical protein
MTISFHPNRLPFHGILTLVDQPSDKSPAGARGHRVILTRAAAEAALPTLLGMAIDYCPTWDKHDARNKIGVITAARLDGAALRVSGHIYGYDFPNFTGAIQAQAAAVGEGTLGMSYELADSRVEDLYAEVWKLTRVTFTGAAILLKDKAAYRGTEFHLGVEGGAAE